MNDKRRIRAELIAARSHLDREERAARSLRIADRLAALDAFSTARTIAVFAPLGAEVDPLPAADRAAARGATIVFPRIRAGERLLEFAPCEPARLVTGPAGAGEPPAASAAVAPGAIDVVLVPGVAFSADGHRLGRGGGYYDATLPALPRAVRVGVAFELQILPALPREPHDAPLDAIVTEARTLRFDVSR